MQLKFDEPLNLRNKTVENVKENGPGDDRVDIPSYIKKLQFESELQ